MIITLSSVVALIVLGSLCAYTIARRKGHLSDLVYILFVLGYILPFQLAIIPLYVAMRHLGLIGNYAGMIVLNIGLLMPLTVFLYTGFIRTLPRDYEEAARVDGAGILQDVRQGRLSAASADHRHGGGAASGSASGTSSSPR